MHELHWSSSLMPMASVLGPSCICVVSEQGPRTPRLGFVSSASWCQSGEYEHERSIFVDEHRSYRCTGHVWLPTHWREVPAVRMSWDRRYNPHTRPQVRSLDLHHTLLGTDCLQGVGWLLLIVCTHARSCTIPHTGSCDYLSSAAHRCRLSTHLYYLDKAERQDRLEGYPTVPQTVILGYPPP